MQTHELISTAAVRLRSIVTCKQFSIRCVKARAYDEENAREHCTIVERLAPWVTVAPQFRRGQQRFDECPKVVVEYRLGHVLFVVETMKRLIYELIRTSEPAGLSRRYVTIVFPPPGEGERHGQDCPYRC